MSRSTELCKLEKKSTIASIKYFSKHRNITRFIWFHVKAPSDLSERVYYLKYFIIIHLIAVTRGLIGRISAESPSRVCKAMANFPNSTSVKMEL